MKRYKKRLEEKMNMFEVEIENHALPREFYLFITYARGLSFDEKPDYAYLRKLFMDLFIEQKFEKDGVFDWSSLDLKTDKD